MTIQTEISDVIHDGDGATTSFSVPFYFTEAADVRVYLIEAGGTRTPLSSPGQYALTGAGNDNGGIVVLTAAPTASEKVFIKRDPPVTQTLRYSSTGRFPAESHQTALDKATMIDQRTREMVSRAIRIPEEEDAAPALLPPAAVRAGKALLFDDDGLPTAMAVPQPILDKTKLDGVEAGAQVNMPVASSSEVAAGTSSVKVVVPQTLAPSLAAKVTASGGSINATTVTYPGESTPVPVSTLFLDRTNPYLHGALPGAGNDATDGLQKALATGKCVDLMGQRWYVSAPLKILASGQYILTEDERSAIISTTAAGNIVEIGDGANEVRNCGFVGSAKIWSTVAKASGTYAIFAAKAARVTLDVRVGALEDMAADGNRLWHGLGLDTCSYLYHYNGVGGFRKTGIAMWSAANQGTELNFYGIVAGGFENGSSTPWGEIGVHIGGGCGGVHLWSGGAQNCLRGVVVSQDLASGVPNREIFVIRGYAPDANTLHNILVKTNSVSGVFYSNVYSGGSGRCPVGYTYPADVGTLPGYGVGIEFQPGQLGQAIFDISGMHLQGNARHGIVHGGGNLVMLGTQSTGNGYGSAPGHGFFGRSGCTDGMSSIGCIMGRNGLLPDLSGPSAGGGSGYVLEAGYDFFQILDGEVRFNGSGPAQFFGGLGTSSKEVRGLLGFDTEVKTVFTIPSGSSSVIVPTGMGIAPRGVLVTPKDRTAPYVEYLKWGANGVNVEVFLTGAATNAQTYSLYAWY